LLVGTRNYVHVQFTENTAAGYAGPPEEAALIRLTALRPGARRVAGSEPARIVAAQSGDREAFDALAENHRSEIRKFIQKRVGKDQADDLLQEIWLAAWLSIREFDSRSRFRTWLFGIAINKCKTHYRTQQRKMAYVPIEELPPERQRAPSPAPLSDLEARIPSAIESLSENHRQLLDLYYYGELTLPEISRLLDRNLNTVKYQFYRAHTELADLIKENVAR